MYKEYKPNMAPKKNPMPSQDPKVKWQLTKQKDA